MTVGNIFFKSGHDGSSNPAVDTVAAGGTVTWTWTSTGNVPHSVESIGSRTFTSSAIQSGDGVTYQMQFADAGHLSVRLRRSWGVDVGDDRRSVRCRPAT